MTVHDSRMTNMPAAWTTFPLLPISSDGSCGCGDRSCANAGKHPAVKWGRKVMPAGTKTPIPDGFGVGLATGERSGVFVVDLDVKNGVNGIAALQELGTIPATLAADTPSGGVHLYFRYPGFPVTNSASALGPGIDIRGDGGYVVLPPSQHRNGGHYRWVAEGADIATAPAWLLDLLRNGPGTRVITRERLGAVAKKWKRSSNSSVADMGEALQKVFDGEPYAQDGERDVVTFKLTKDLAKEFPGADPEKLAELFIPSLSLMGDDAPDVLEKLCRAFEELAAEDDSWLSKLAMAESGTPKACVGNCKIILEHHEAFQGVFGFDERRLEIVVQAPPPWGGKIPRGVKDTDAIELATWFTMEHKMPATSGMAMEAIAAVAQNAPYDRVREYLEGLTWDGTERLATWLPRLAGGHDTPYTRAVGVKWCLSAVARALDPGCKVDTMLILEGEQGRKKSTALKVIAGEDFFTDTMPTIGDKDALLQIHGPWIIEVQELDAFDKREATAVKSFMSVCRDRFRSPYGRTTKEHDRKNVFAGTTNRETYFSDETGNRRFWPVATARDCDVVLLAAERDQLWAEAVARYRGGEKWWLEGEAEALAKEEQAKRTHEDVGAGLWAPRITAALRDGVLRNPLDQVRTADAYVIQPGCRDVSTGEILEHVMGISLQAVTTAMVRRAAAELRGLGWERFNKKVGKQVLKRFRVAVSP